MEKNTAIIALIGLVAGFAGGYLFTASSQGTPPGGMHVMPGGMMMHDEGMGMGNAMDDMMEGLQGKSGDDFDKAFLAEMITHHQGAVSMAQAALASAKHDEIKQMAQAIISAQTAEINQMRDWQKSWYSQ